MITIEKGDIFNATTEAIVLPFTTDVSLQYGFLKESKKKFPENYEFLLDQRKQNMLAIKQIYVNKVNNELIINFPVARRHNQRCNLGWLIAGITQLRNYLMKNHVRSIAIPALGTGTGTLYWYRVKQLFERAFSEFETHIILYEPRHMENEFTEDDIVGFECKHAIARLKGKNDIVFVKEKIHLKDKRVIPNTRLWHNYQRPFWVTKEGFRNHNEKKEWEEERKLEKFMINQAQLTDKIATVLGRPGADLSLRELSNSLWLYGSDITVTALLKREEYQDKYNLVSSNTLAVIDIETDVANRTNEIIYISVTSKDRVFLASTKKFLAGIPNPEEQLQNAFERYLGEYKEKRNINLEIFIADTPAEACYEVIQRCHDWQPDFVGVWNVNFDLKKILEALKKENYDVGEVFSDPIVPDGFRTARYIEAPKIKVKADGTKTSKNATELWHTMDCAASFYFVDNMVVYRTLRAAKGNESSYKLNDVLDNKLGLKKLHFDEILAEKAPHLAGKDSTLEWHIFMQKNYKIEYGIYNIFDCIGVELLDEKEGDIRSVMGALANHSDFSKFASQPRLLVDDMHYEVKEDGCIIGTTGSKMRNEIDEMTLTLRDWITTLPSFLISEDGAKIIEELPDQNSLCYVHVAD